MGALNKFFRVIRHKFFDLSDWIWDKLPIQKFRRSKIKKSNRRPGKKKRKEWENVEISSREKRSIPGYRKFKTLLAAGLLLLNLVFSQFILGSQTEGQIMFLMFLGNSFILADYLWKMRRKPE